MRTLHQNPNHELLLFPKCLIGGVLGFRSREYLVAEEGKMNMPNMK